MSHRPPWICGLILLALATPTTRAEVPLRRPDEVRREATHIVVGKVRAVYRSVETGRDFERTRGVVELLIEEVEKGEGPKGGEVIYVRFWNDRWVGKGPVTPHSGGHHVPAVGSAVRAYVRRDREGSYEALLPNGLEAMREPAKGPPR